MHEFPIEFALFVVVGLVGSNLLSYYSSKVKIFPEIIWVLLLGVGYGLLSKHPLLSIPTLELNESVVFYIFVPLLIFASTQKICLHHLRKVLIPASIVASIGILISMLVIAAGLYYILDLPLLVSLLFGVILSATDPLAIGALLSSNTSISQSKKLFIEAESILNDGFVVTVFGILFAIIFENETFSVGISVVDLMLHIFGSLACGIVLGRLARTLLRVLKEDHFIYRVNITLALAYGSFLLGEGMGFSGILSVFFAALSFGYKPNVEDHDIHTQKHLWEYFEFITNSALFFILGASVVELIDISLITFWLISLAIVLIFMSRLLATACLWPIIIVDKKRLNLLDFLTLNFSGARGAVSVALLLLLPDTFVYKELFITLAFIMVLFTLLVYPKALQATLDKSQTD